MANQAQLVWYDPNWQRQAHAWIRSQTEMNSLLLTGEIEQPHAYAWSTVMRVPTNKGMLFFKATAGETIYEIALTEKLAAWFPDCLPELIAVDAARGWMLLRDGGEQLRVLIRPTQDVKPWEPVITRYADLQIELTQHVPEILALGIPDYRLSVLPDLYAQLLADPSSSMIDQEKGLASKEYQQVQNLTERFKGICAELDTFGLPASLNHGDFHDGNVLIKDGRVTFFDWGDANMTHPFMSLRTFFVSMEIALQLDDYAPATPEMIQLLDRYLERWEAFASKERLLAAYNLSRPVASIVKALSWHQTISQLDGSLREKYAWILPELWREFMIYEKMLTE
ncbi:MAG TPA: phosphotransferase [Anaerolineales bacterium]|nr:phosphotransferase [Anaerolineales bacterium]